MKEAVLVLLAALGTLVIIAVSLDFVGTTLSAGGGFLTRRLIRLLWRPTGMLRRRVPHLAAAATGPALLLGVFVIWIGLFWAGWLLVFSADPASVIASQTRAPASLGERAYFVGFTLSTLGVGDFVPGGSPWRFLTAVAAFNGFAAITLAITYFVTIIQAATQGRALARELQALGRSGEEILAGGWTGSDFGPTVSSLAQLRSALFRQGDQSRAIPIIYYFGGQDGTSLAKASAALLDAVILLESGVAPDVRPSRAEIAGLRQAIATIVPFSMIGKPAAPPLPLSRNALESKGVPLGDSDDFHRALAESETLRAAVHAWARYEGDRIEEGRAS